MAKPFKNVKSDGTTADIYIYGPIGYSWWDENSWDAAGFVAEFNRLSRDHDRINVHINSPGGIIDEGLPMFNAIQSCEKETHTYIDGIAYSMGAIIALAGKTVHAAKNSLMLFHNASGWAQGNAEDFREVAKMLDTYDSSLITSLSTKTGMSEDDVRSKYFDFKDHLLSASQAKDEGFIDIIEDYTAQVPEDISKLTSNQLFSLFYSKDHKDPLMNKILDFFRNNFSFTNNTTSNMDFTASIGKLLGLENATEETVTNAINTLNQKVTDLTTQVNNLTASAQTAQASCDSFVQALDAIDDSIRDASDNALKITALNTVINGLRNQDATGKTIAPKDQDVIETPAEDSFDKFEHNRAADQFLG